MSIHQPIPESIAALPPIAGWETEVQTVMQTEPPISLPSSPERPTAAFAIALHMHQPTIPAGPDGTLINHLQYMFEHPQDGDNHNAAPFADCYGRMGDFIPELVQQGYQPRVMLDYSGTLLWGLQQMGREDILDRLKRITCDPAYYAHVEWLGTFWGHAVVPSTPIPDIKLQIQAWQQQFAALFGWEALSRVRGFSPPEMHLPNHPDTLYTFIQALLDCGYRWLLVQEHTIETLDGQGIPDPHIPHRLVARNAAGEVVTIPILIKTQGSDTKLVGQMQPYAEAKTLSRRSLGGSEIPPLVSQIGDGENGGVMMNEFPAAFHQVWPQIQANPSVVGMNGSEYLAYLANLGVQASDFPSCQAIGQHHLWPFLEAGMTVEAAIAQVRQDHPSCHFEGASWTNHISWVQGYDNVLSPMQELSVRLHDRFDALRQSDPTITRTETYRRALLYTLLLETSCFRYWGQGTWTDYAQRLYHQGLAAIDRPASVVS